MIEKIIITILLLGDSQTHGQMGRLLEENYRNHGIEVVREASPGKGVRYFLSATRPPSVKNVSTSKQKRRIRHALYRGVDYIIVGSLGGNDAHRNCCNKRNGEKLLKIYRKFFKQLCTYNTIVIFNGSPPANRTLWPVFDKRRKVVDDIQARAAKGTCVIQNSVRGLRIPTDPDGYHYNRSAQLYAEFLMQLPGMNLPIIEQ